MGIFDDIEPDKQMPVTDTNRIAGFFECLTCYEQVRGAVRVPKDKTIKYECSEGHVSEVPYV